MTTETTAESLTVHEPEVAEILARWQTAFGKYSYAELADRIGSSRETVRRMAHGQLPTTLVIARACRTFGIRAEWILLGTGPMHVHSEIQLERTVASS